MKDLLLFIAKSLVDKPEAVSVVEVEGEKTTVLELRVASEDLGKVIGKEGRTARSLHANSISRVEELSKEGPGCPAGVDYLVRDTCLLSLQFTLKCNVVGRDLHVSQWSSLGWVVRRGVPPLAIGASYPSSCGAEI